MTTFCDLAPLEATCRSRTSAGCFRFSVSSLSPRKPVNHASIVCEECSSHLTCSGLGAVKATRREFHSIAINAPGCISDRKRCATPSQGAKPGHGGILPAAKLTPEIAAIRHVPLGFDVISPPRHSAFSTPIELLQFIAQPRELSGGKPVGFKLCVGKRRELLAVCKAMVKTGITPDFIAVDGGEGGTGAAP